MAKSHWASSSPGVKSWWKSKRWVWLVRTATVVPDNERWLHAPATASDLSNALTWAAQNAPSDAALDSTLTRLSHGQQ